MYITKQKQTHRYRKLTSGYQLGERREEGQEKGRGLRDTNYLLCIKQIRNKDILYSTGKYSNYSVITLNGVYSIKILNHYAVYLKLI